MPHDPMTIERGSDPLPQFIEACWRDANKKDHEGIIATSLIEWVGRAEYGDGAHISLQGGIGHVHYIRPTYDEFVDLLVRRPQQWREALRFVAGVDLASGPSRAVRSIISSDEDLRDDLTEIIEEMECRAGQRNFHLDAICGDCRDWARKLRHLLGLEKDGGTGD